MVQGWKAHSWYTYTQGRLRYQKTYPLTDEVGEKSTDIHILACLIIQVFRFQSS